MTKTIIAFILGFLVIGSPLSLAADDPAVFKKNNPDGLKFEFARSYISSLGYLHNVDERWKKSDAIKEKNTEEQFVRWNIERLIYDNMDIRVAKNYLIKYFRMDNSLMRKVTDSYVNACDQLVEINRQERDVWEGIKQEKLDKSFSAAKEQKFLSQQQGFALKRKEAMKGIVEATVLMTKILLSEDTKTKDVKKRLAIQTRERDKLIEKLDGFAKDNYDWGIKPGQTLLQAAEASIREVLEDPIYISADEQ